MLRLCLLVPLLLASRQEKSLGEQIDALVQGLKLKEARVGIQIVSAKSGRTVYAKDENELFELASNTKLLTTSAALCRLGPDFKFHTAVGLIGEDLHVFGGGDPNISGRFLDDDPTAIFRKWSEKLKEAGIDKVENLVLHTGIFDGERVNPGWKSYDPWHWWVAPFGPLSLNDNCVDLKIEPGEAGEPCKAILKPETAYVKIVNRTKTAAGRPGRPFRLTREAGTPTITLGGEVGAREHALHWVAVEDPTLYFGTVLKETLAAAGIVVNGKIEESPVLIEDGKDFKELASWESDLLASVGVCNGPSQNFYAEMILRTLGWKTKGKGTLENGLAAVRDFLRHEVKVEKTAPQDGSGLTRGSKAPPSEIVKLLLHMRGHAYAKEFAESLAVNGAAKGTLKSRMTAADVKGKVRAKTGHIDGVSALSGYVESQGGDTYIFSILVNCRQDSSAAPADRLQDRICELLARWKD